MSIEDGGPAFPQGDDRIGHEGMMLRDYFAAQVLPAMFESAVIQNNRVNNAWPVVIPEIAEKAYAMADAMIKARNQ